MRAFAVAARLLLATSLLVAGGAQAQAQSADPPARVGRLSLIEGTVSSRQPEQEQWAPAVLNYPVGQGMAFWTEPDAKTEIQTGGANVRLDQSTELNVARLDDDATQLRVEQGSVNLAVSSVPPGGLSVLTPQGEAQLLRPGRYRIDAQPEQSEVSVLDGEARVNQTRASADLRSGESVVLAGDGFSRREAQATPFDHWAAQRERMLVAAAQADSGRYVSRAIPGYQDLDNHGRWRTVPDLGPVWYPTVTPTWAPYRYGHWAYVAPWGWTWIDDAPWGFAPFHYGRWVRDDWGWGWYPGPVVARPVYAPALVAFIGGAGWGVSIASGPRAAVGWVPLAPREVFRPYYRASRTYVRNVNITQVNQTVINNVTVNRTRNVTVNNFANQGAATVVPTAAFTRAGKVQQAAVELPKQQLAAAPVSTQLAHLKPTAAARAGSAPAQASATAAPTTTTPARVSRQPVRERSATADAPAPQAPGPALRPQAVAPRQEARPGTVVRPQATAPTSREGGSVSRIAPAAGPTPAAPSTGDPRRGNEPQAKPQTQAAPGPALRQAPNRPDQDERGAPRTAQPQAAPPPSPQPAPRPTVAQPPRRDAGEPQTRSAPIQPSARPAPATQQAPAPTPQARPSLPAPPQPSISATPRAPPPPPQAARTEPSRPTPPPVVRAEPPRPAPPVARTEPPRPAAPPPPVVRAEPPRPAPPVVRAEPPRPAPPPTARPAPPPQAAPPPAARAAPPPQPQQAQPQRAPAKPASPQQDEKRKGG